MTDFDNKTYVAVYDQFQVFKIYDDDDVSDDDCDNDDDDDHSCDAGWSRRRLRADSGRVQRCPLHSWRLAGDQIQWRQHEWEEVHHKVRFKS